jgi:phosphoribosylanthranilate isomerase
VSTRLKVCCIQSVDEARTALAHGADALGLVSAMPSGPGPIDDALIADIVRHIPAGVATFLLTCEVDGAAIVEQVAAAGTSTVQLVDAVAPEAYRMIRRELPGVRIVQVLHVWEDAAIEEARQCGEFVDALLLDSGSPRAAVKLLGGTGRVHNWEVSRRIVESINRPVWLAGGLSALNARDAIARVGPFGLDVCSGVRRNGLLDPVRLGAMADAMGLEKPPRALRTGSGDGTKRTNRSDP